MPVSGVTSWYRPESVLPGNTWINPDRAIDGSTTSFASYSLTIIGGSWTRPVGAWGGFSAAASSIPIGSIVTGLELKATLAVTGSVSSEKLNLYVRYEDTNPAIYTVGTEDLQSSSGSVIEYANTFVQDFLYPITPNDLSKLVIRSSIGFSGSNGQTWNGYIYDIQARFTYLSPSLGKRIRDTGFKTCTTTGVNGTGSNTISWTNPGNASVLDGAYATFADDKDDTNVLFGSNWSFNIPNNATPIALVPSHIVGSNHTHTYGYAFWNYRATDGGTLLDGNYSSDPVGWMGSKGLLDNSVSAATLNSSWFGFGFRRDDDAFVPSQAEVDQFLAKVYFEDDENTGIVLISGF